MSTGSPAVGQPGESRCVLIAGASGLIGQALAADLRSRGMRVRRLVRHDTTHADEIRWEPAIGRLAPEALHGVEAVINLAGVNIAGGRWSAARRAAILRSRVDATRTLVAAIDRAARKPSTLVSASAVGWYGDRGDEVLTEASLPGSGFLAEVCQAWEAEAAAAERTGVRTCCVRLGVVLARSGGALPKMLRAFRFGLGGRVGHGRQWMSWIGLADAVGAIEFVLDQPACRGPLNAVAPEPVRNEDFARALGRAVHRPALVPVPTGLLRLVFGEMADATLLASACAVPEKLQAAGYAFQHPTLDAALRSALAP